MAYDNNPYVIALWKKILQSDFVFPDYPTREDWDRCKNKIETNDWYIGYVSIFASNMTGGFPAGYDKYGLRYNGRINNCKADIPLLQDVIFDCKDYSEVLKAYNNAVIYCDPPYANSHQYNYNKFNTEKFWNDIREASMNNYIFISEQNAPEDFISIWELTIKHNIRGNFREAVEHLYIYNNGLAVNN